VSSRVAASHDDIGLVRSSWRALLHRWTLARYTAYHYVGAAIPMSQVVTALREYPRYLQERRAYSRLTGEPLERYFDNPQLLDRTANTPFDPHYTHQDAWAAREIYRQRPERHVDVGSRITFVAGLAAFARVTFVDVRPLDAEIPGLDVREGTVLSLPFADRSVSSISCLHVAEHVGLGRYGDPLDPEGTRKAAVELARVLAPGGRLYFSIPVGEPRTEFNAHRVHHPEDVPGLFPGLRLVAFSGVDDRGRWREDLSPRDLNGARWACGFYTFSAD
jgi:SAM-dependent methyltransferase